MVGAVQRHITGIDHKIGTTLAAPRPDTRIAVKTGRLSPIWVSEICAIRTVMTFLPLRSPNKTLLSLRI